MKPGESDNKDAFDQENVSSNDAMDEYFFDMLGSVADQQPLKQCEEEDGLSFHSSYEREPFSALNESLKQSSPSIKPKKKPISKVEFAEPARTKISPLIIPAAFPKLAPVAEKPKTEIKTETVEEVKTEVVEELKTKVDTTTKQSTKLDRKTALAILEKKKSKLTEAQLARLEAKLGLNTESETKKKTKVDTKPKVAQQTQVVKPKLEVKVETKQNTKVVEATNTKTVEREKVLEAAPVIETQDIVESELSQTPGQPGKMGPPAWAQDRFECLIFTVAGLKLAVPLVSLGAVYKMDHELTPIVGRADYFMGLYRHLDRNVSVLDTAQWVMPDRWTEAARDSYRFIIRLGGSNWGLACDSVHESIQLETDMVKWRSERTSRAWLSGTVIGHMCALLDADVLSSMLEQKMSSN